VGGRNLFWKGDARIEIIIIITSGNKKGKW